MVQFNPANDRLINPKTYWLSGSTTLLFLSLARFSSSFMFGWENFISSYDGGSNGGPIFDHAQLKSRLQERASSANWLWRLEQKQRRSLSLFFVVETRCESKTNNPSKVTKRLHSPTLADLLPLAEVLSSLCVIFFRPPAILMFIIGVCLLCSFLFAH